MKTRNHGRNRSAFTLIEILVVVLIITILATVVGVRLAQQPGEARVTAARAQIRNFQTAINLFRLHNGFIPTPAQGLEALVRKPTTPPLPQNYAANGYLETATLPSDPWGNPYVYIVPGRDGLACDIISYGADGEPGGEGENADLALSQM